MEDNFWNDETVLEFIEWSDSLVRKDAIDKFKKSKEIPKKDYEIQSFKNCYEGMDEVLFEINNSGVFHPSKGFRETYTLTYLLSQPTAKMHSVKRLSDGEVFSVGGEYAYGKVGIITKFKISPIGEMLVDIEFDKINSYSNAPLRAIDVLKPKVPLFTCFDGAWNYVGDYIYPLRVCDFCVAKAFTTSEDQNDLSNLNKEWHYFSSEELRQKYVIENKPIEVTMKDFLSLWFYDYKLFKTSVETYFKSKINV